VFRGAATPLKPSARDLSDPNPDLIMAEGFLGRMMEDGVAQVVVSILTPQIHGKEAHELATAVEPLGKIRPHAAISCSQPSYRWHLAVNPCRHNLSSFP